MNKNLFLIVILAVLALSTYVAVFFFGRNSVKPPEPKTVVTESVKYDTLTILKKVYVTKTVQVQSKGDSIKTYTDSIAGDTADVKYNISHSVTDSAKAIKSFWKVDIEPHIQSIVKTITRDSIETRVNTVYLPKPLLLNDWFYVSMAEAGLIVLFIIKLIL